MFTCSNSTFTFYSFNTNITLTDANGQHIVRKRIFNLIQNSVASFMDSAVSKQ